MNAALIAHLHDLFEPIGPITTRAMFGGHGVYVGGVIVGIVIDGGFYLKTDAQTSDRFVQAGCAPYVYTRQGKPLPLSYWSVPAGAMETPEAMRPWAELAIEAAARKRAGGTRRRRKTGAP